MIIIRALLWVGQVQGCEAQKQEYSHRGTVCWGGLVGWVVAFTKFQHLLVALVISILCICQTPWSCLEICRPCIIRCEHNARKCGQVSIFWCANWAKRAKWRGNFVGQKRISELQSLCNLGVRDIVGFLKSIRYCMVEVWARQPFRIPLVFWGKYL